MPTLHKTIIAMDRAIPVAMFVVVISAGIWGALSALDSVWAWL